MLLRDLIQKTRDVNICIKKFNTEGLATKIYEGNSQFYRMSKLEEYMSVLYVTPHRYIPGELFIMVTV